MKIIMGVIKCSILVALVSYSTQTNINKGDLKVYRISKGQKAKKNEFPFFAQLEITEMNATDGFMYFCGASLISPDWILTAAHCFPNGPAKIEETEQNLWVKVYMGSNKRYDNKVKPNWVVRIVVHPRHFSNLNVIEGQRLDNDIALGRLKNTYRLNQAIQAVVLPRAPLYGAQTKRCKTGVLIGIGRISEDPPQYPSFVQYAKITWSNRTQLSIPIDKPCVDSVFYSESKWLGTHPLEGDSGSPFICYQTVQKKKVSVLYGIQSNGKPQGDLHVATYEEVDQHIFFIRYFVPEVSQTPRKRTLKLESYNHVLDITTVPEIEKKMSSFSFRTRANLSFMCICIIINSQASKI